MLRNERTIQFQSPLASLMDKFIQEKRACGYRYLEGAASLKRYDQFLCKEELKLNELPKPIVLKWLTKQKYESASTHRSRIGIARQFAIFLNRLNYPAYVPHERFGAKEVSSFSARILTHAEIKKLFKAIDHMTPSPFSPMRHIIMPEVFRLLYGCGFRVSEVLHLRIHDVDLNQGVLTVRGAKFGKDRLVPPSVTLIKRLRIYAATLEDHSPDAFFFPSPTNGPWSIQATYTLFRKMLYQCGITHGGRGKGARLHDLRHTFAVHKLIQ